METQAPRKDFVLVAIIGFLIGLLAQPVLSNFSEGIAAAGISLGLVRAAALLGLPLLALLALFIASLIGRSIPVLYQFAKFAAVGTLNSFVDFGVFNLETLMFGIMRGDARFPIFKGISFLAGTTNSYFWNRYWTFHTDAKPTAGEAFKFYAIAIAGFVLNVGVATAVFRGQPAGISVDLWGNIVAPLAGILSAFLWNFFGYKFIVFRKKELGTQAASQD